jgi:hypothetical protein
MEIHVSYQPTAKELTKAGSLFVEKKPFFLITIQAMNLFAIVIGVLLCIKLFKFGLTKEEWLAGLTALVWLFGRRPMNEWLLFQRIKKNKILQSPIQVVFSLNGVMWEGKGLATGHMPWQHVRYITEVKNGFLIPNASTRYLWLPFRSFKSPSDINTFRNLLNEKQIIRRYYPKWEC